MVKFFVLDTNVLLYSAASLESFADNDVVIPMAVVEELDKFKRNADENGRNCRQVIRMLDKLRQKGNLREGAPLRAVGSAASGRVFVPTCAAMRRELGDTELAEVFQNDLGNDTPDNRILQVAFLLQLKYRDRPVIFISKDINLRLKADALGLRVMDFEREKVDPDTLYTGYREIRLDDSAWRTARENGFFTPSMSLLANEFVAARRGDSDETLLARRNAAGKAVALPRESRKIWNVSARNREQAMALDLLLDPAVALVTLSGGAGTGKTLLALAAGLEETINRNRYDKILVSRPIIPLGNDIGFLPGDKGSKLSSWMRPIYDNLEFLLTGQPSAPAAAPGGKNSAKNRYNGYSPESLVNSKRLELEAITYIRGRSLPRQYVIIDEAQNLTPHEVKTIISRAGEGTKIVLTGDPAQIDNPYIDASSNGLSYLVEHFKGEPLYGHVTLARSERSPLAALAAARL